MQKLHETMNKKEKSMSKLDKIDKLILSALQEDARITNLDLAINTTPLGMYKEDSEDFFNIPVNESTILIDLIYTAKETLFLKKFDKCSKRINGLDMFIFQALKSIEIWRETNYNLDSQIESVRKQLENIKC